MGQESLGVCKNQPSLKTPEASGSRRASPASPAGPEKVPAGTDRIELQALIEAFIRYQESIGRAAATLERHRVELKYWRKYLAGEGLLDAGDGLSLAAITPRIAAGFQAWVFNYQTRFGRPFTLSTQIGILNSLQVFYQYLAKTGQVLSNPAQVIRLPKSPRKLPATILAPKEMKRLLAQPDTATVLGFRDRTMYEVLYATGLRIGELIGLRVQDLAPAEGMLCVRAGKGGKDRVVPLGATAGRYLAEYLRRIRPLFRQAAGTDALFFNKYGRPHRKGGIWNKLKLYALRAGIPKRITVHTFRHTLATEMLKAGADLRQIQEMLGHASLRSTQLYTHVVKGELKRVQAACHPREQAGLPAGFVRYRGRRYLTAEENREAARLRQRERPPA